MSCCSSTYNAGCYNHCGTLRLGIAEETVTLTGVFEFAGIHFTQDVELVNGEQIEIGLSNLNENAKYTLTLYNSDNEVYELTIADVVYDCFTFKTQIWYNSTAEIVADDESCCETVLLTMTGVSSRVIDVTEWSQFGTIPSIEVIVKENGVYTSVPVNWVPDVMPSPTTITVSLGSIPADAWYIRLK